MLRISCNTKEIFQPIRMALTGSHSGPEFDKLIPLIENGAVPGLNIPNVSDHIERFVGASAS
jgi:glutamyl/glutaminyl-tRNA synthetase